MSNVSKIVENEIARLLLKSEQEGLNIDETRKLNFLLDAKAKDTHNATEVIKTTNPASNLSDEELTEQLRALKVNKNDN